jgi:hypothetical protein
MGSVPHPGRRNRIFIFSVVGSCIVAVVAIAVVIWLWSGPWISAWIGCGEHAPILAWYGGDQGFSFPTWNTYETSTTSGYWGDALDPISWVGRPNRYFCSESEAFAAGFYSVNAPQPN